MSVDSLGHVAVDATDLGAWKSFAVDLPYWSPKSKNSNGAWDKVAAGAAPVHSTFGKHSDDEMLSFHVTTPSGFAIEYGFAGKLVDCATWTPARHDGASLRGHKHRDPDEPDV